MKMLHEFQPSLGENPLEVILLLDKKVLHILIISWV